MADVISIAVFQASLGAACKHHFALRVAGNWPRSNGHGIALWPTARRAELRLDGLILLRRIIGLR